MSEQCRRTGSHWKSSNCPDARRYCSAKSPGIVRRDAPTVLLYGHYDKQPEFTGWHDGLGPWTPVIRDGRLYGRGGADDGYAMFASLTAIAALQQQGCRCRAACC